MRACVRASSSWLVAAIVAAVSVLVASTPGSKRHRERAVAGTGRDAALRHRRRCRPGRSRARGRRSGRSASRIALGAAGAAPGDRAVARRRRLERARRRARRADAGEDVRSRLLSSRARTTGQSAVGVRGLRPQSSSIVDVPRAGAPSRRSRPPAAASLPLARERPVPRGTRVRTRRAEYRRGWLLEQPNRVDYAITGRRAGDRHRRTPLGPRDAGRQVAGVSPDAAHATGDPVELRDERPHDRRRRRRRRTVWFRRSERFSAYFTVRGSMRTTLLPRVLHMTAAAHFMTDRYESFNLPRAIYPPR